MQGIGLVLEGGGMRGVYTCGVLEFFLEKELFFNYIIGVSAGACNAVSYISGQKGRNEKVNIDFVKDSRYMSLRNFMLEKSFFGMNFIFGEIPKKLNPFDHQAFQNSPCNFLIGVTDCTSGKPVYLDKEAIDEDFTGLRATASLPMLSPILTYKGMELLDGGIADPIPIRKSIEDGNNKNIIILTRNIGYRKVPSKFNGLIKLKYKNYPKLVKAMNDRYKNYNETLNFIDELERTGKAIVIRPSKELRVGRIERNTEKLQLLFKNGYEDAKEHYCKIMKFIK
jgi:predicted patatin/cPLA2 family phospholipase